MRLIIDGVEREFISIKTLREQFILPEVFGVALFQAKDYTGLGSIERAGAELNAVRDATLAAVPHTIKQAQLLSLAPQLQAVFLQQLHAINETVQLRDAEIDFAVAGFGDVVSAFTFALVRASVADQATPTFASVYRDWLNQTVRIASSVYSYPHGDAVWGVQVIAHAYGRIGLMIETGESMIFAYDPALACPAEGFMAHLLQNVCQQILQNFQPS